jgi:hypothetical protein
MGLRRRSSIGEGVLSMADRALVASIGKGVSRVTWGIGCNAVPVKSRAVGGPRVAAAVTPFAANSGRVSR